CLFSSFFHLWSSIWFIGFVYQQFSIEESAEIDRHFSLLGYPRMESLIHIFRPHVESGGFGIGCKHLFPANGISLGNIWVIFLDHTRQFIGFESMEKSFCYHSDLPMACSSISSLSLWIYSIGNPFRKICQTSAQAFSIRRDVGATGFSC